jgi:RecA-family ATPase
MSVVVSGSEYLSLPRSAETWLVRPLVPAGGSVLLYGDPKVGKSFAAIQLAMAIQQGGEWFGFPVEKSGPVVYVQLDTPRSLWAERIENLRTDGLPTDSLLLVDRETLDVFPFDILDPTHATLLNLALREVDPVAVIIDTIRESHSGVEDDSTTMRNVVSSLVAATQPAALILVSHARKPSYDSPGDLINDNRGSGYVSGRMDSIIRFSKRTVHYTGRAIEEGSLRIRRTDNGLWEADNADVDAQIKAVLADPSFTSVKQRAGELALRIGRGEEACRSLLRRYAATVAD